MADPCSRPLPEPQHRSLPPGCWTAAVSNLGQTVVTFDAIGLSRFARTLTGSAVSFTAGSNPGGYLVSAVRLRVATVAGATPRVSIYSDISGRPGSSLKTLNNPANLPSFTQTQYDDGVIVSGDSDWARDFGADNFKLAKDTTYWVVIERASGSGGVIYDYTGSLAEDSGEARGWSIDGAYYRNDTQTWSDADSSDVPMQFSIIGPQVATASVTPGYTGVYYIEVSASGSNTGAYSIAVSKSR